jgi:hypothetical protein
MKMAVFWVVAPRRRDSLPKFQGSLLMMEAVQTSETLVNSYQSTRHYKPEDNHLQELCLHKLCFLYLIFVYIAIAKK